MTKLEKEIVFLLCTQTSFATIFTTIGPTLGTTNLSSAPDSFDQVKLALSLFIGFVDILLALLLEHQFQ
jgi:hypothetical protein